MKSLIGHIAAGTVGSTLASVVIESGSRIAAALMIVGCLCFVATQLNPRTKRPNP